MPKSNVPDSKWIVPFPWWVLKGRALILCVQDFCNFSPENGME